MCMSPLSLCNCTIYLVECPALWGERERTPPVVLNVVTNTYRWSSSITSKKSRRDKIGITRHIVMHQVLYNVHVTLFESNCTIYSIMICLVILILSLLLFIQSLYSLSKLLIYLSLVLFLLLLVIIILLS